MQMVKALCCHTFARQNLFSPVTKATAVTSADSLALVASEDLRIRVYDLNDPSTVLSEIVTSGRVRSLSVCAKDSIIVSLESSLHSSSSTSSRRTVRCYRNFFASPFNPGPVRSALQPPASTSNLDSAPELLEFSGLNSPLGLVLRPGLNSETQLAVSAGKVVWLARYVKSRFHFQLDCSLKFNFNIHRLDLQGDLLAAASTEEVHLVRLCSAAPPKQNEDAILLPTIEKERREVARSQKGLEVLGPTTELDVAPVTLSPTSQTSARFVRTLLFKRLPQSQTTKLHSVQLIQGKEPSLLVASTFEGFSFIIGETVRRSAHYAFTERTLKARIGNDGLVHVITTCGLNTFTSRLGGSDSYAVPARYPICLIGSLVWREIHLRTLETWDDGLLLYTERDNLHTLYSLKFQSSADLFSDMMQMARMYIPDSPTTSCHLQCEAFHLFSLREGVSDREKVATLVEFYLCASCSDDELRALLSLVDLSVEDVVEICEQMQRCGLEIRDLLRVFVESDRKFPEKLRDASQEVVAMFYALLSACDKKLQIHSLLIRNDTNYLLSHEEVLLSLPSDDPHALLINCVFLFETSQLDEIESFVCTADEKSFLSVLKAYSHLLLCRITNTMTDFAQLLAIVHPRLLCRFIAEVCDRERLPTNLPPCCRTIIEEEEFCRRPSAHLLPHLLSRLLRFLEEKSLEGCPHRNLRCRHVPLFLLDQRLPLLNVLPPFYGAVPSKVIHSASSSCVCCLCQSALLRLQGLLSWAVASGTDLSVIKEKVSAHLSGLPELVQPSLAFLIADSLPQAFSLLSLHAGLEASEAFLRQEAPRLDRSTWIQMIAESQTAQELQLSSNDKQEAEKPSEAAKEPKSRHGANARATTRSKPEVVTSEEVLRLAVELNQPHVAVQLAEAVPGIAETVRPHLLSRYRSEIAGGIFRNLMTSLEHM